MTEVKQHWYDKSIFHSKLEKPYIEKMKRVNDFQHLLTDKEYYNRGRSSQQLCIDIAIQQLDRVMLELTKKKSQ